MKPQIFNAFPKTRPPLSDDIQQIYAEFYKSNRGGQSRVSNLSQRLESWMHRIIAKKGVTHPGARILDFGSGNFNHFKYEQDYTVYDAVEPFEELYAGHAELDKIDNLYRYAQEIEGNKYDRILSVAVLEHLTDLPREIATCCLLIENRGIFQAGITCEGELAWYLGWRFSSAISFRRKYGLDYSSLMAHEHVNTMREIVEILRTFFDNVRILRSPFPFPIAQLSFYAYIEANSPRLEFAEKYLANTIATEA